MEQMLQVFLKEKDFIQIIVFFTATTTILHPVV